MNLLDATKPARIPIRTNEARQSRMGGCASERHRGRMRNCRGRLAEDAVARIYAGRGRVTDRRWRSRSGEIDMIVRQGDCLVFVEVKARATHHEAAHALGARQVGRILRAAECYLADRELPLNTPMRFDVALVDHAGRITIIENALAA